MKMQFKSNLIINSLINLIVNSIINLTKGSPSQSLRCAVSNSYIYVITDCNSLNYIAIENYYKTV